MKYKSYKNHAKLRRFNMFCVVKKKISNYGNIFGTIIIIIIIKPKAVNNIILLL
jgi:hypothetical protein